MPVAYISVQCRACTLGLTPLRPAMMCASQRQARIVRGRFLHRAVQPISWRVIRRRWRAERFPEMQVYLTAAAAGNGKSVSAPVLLRLLSLLIWLQLKSLSLASRPP